MKPTRFFPLLAGLCSFQMQLSAAPSIGVNFVNGGDHVNNGATDSLGPAESAGAPTFAQINWNNLGRWGQGVVLNPTAGVSGVTVHWDSYGTWTTGGSVATSDGKLMSGYLDASWTGATNTAIAPGTSVYNVGNNNKPMVFVGNLGSWLASSGVNATTYSVVIYFDGDGTDGSRTAEFWLQSVTGASDSMTVGDDLTPHIFATDAANFPDLPVPYTQATSTALEGATPGNFIVFTGLTADQFLIRGEEHGWASDAITGFQIIADQGEVIAQGSYWKGGDSALNMSNNWTGANWTSDLAGNDPVVERDSIVSFAATGATNLATVLGADQSISKLTLTNGVGAVQIGGDHILGLGSDGISIEAGTGPLTINTTGQVMLEAGQTWINNSAGDLTVQSQIAGDFSLTTAGGGTTVLTAANVHTGGTTVQSGTLKIGTAAAVGTGALFVNGTLDINGLNPTFDNLGGNGTIHTSSASASILTLNLTAADSTYAGKINDGPGGGQVSLVKNGPFNLTTTSNSGFTGPVTINEGQFAANYPIYGGAPTTSSLGNLQVDGRTITVNAPGTLALTNNNIFGNGNANTALLPEIILNGATVSSTNYNLIGDITLNAATLTQSMGNGWATYQGYQFGGLVKIVKDPVTPGPSFITGTGTGANHLSDETTFEVEDVTGDGVTVDSLVDLTVSAPLTERSGDFGSGPGGLTKDGDGTMRLEGTNSYTGATKVLKGVLSLGTATLSDIANVEIAEDAVLDLTHSSTDTVAGLMIAGYEQADGVYGAVGSPEVDQEFELPQITGTGLVKVVSDPFLPWIQSFTNLIGADAAKGADPDDDGLTNLEEFALDGNPEVGTPSGKVRSGLQMVGAEEALVITLPVRNGAVLSGTAPAILTVTVDRINYEIGGSNDLVTFDQAVSEVEPALTGSPDMPDLNDGWTYRTFRLNGAVTSRGPKGFLDVKVNSTL